MELPDLIQSSAIQFLSEPQVGHLSSRTTYQYLCHGVGRSLRNDAGKALSTGRGLDEVLRKCCLLLFIVMNVSRVPPFHRTVRFQQTAFCLSPFTCGLRRGPKNQKSLVICGQGSPSGTWWDLPTGSDTCVPCLTVTHLSCVGEGRCLGWSPGGEGGREADGISVSLEGCSGPASGGGGEVMGLELEFRVRPAPGPSSQSILAGTLSLHWVQPAGREGAASQGRER